MGVEEDGCNLATQGDAAKALIGHEGNVLAGGPNHAVSSRLAAGTGTDHIAHISHQMAFFLQIFNELHGSAFAVFFWLERCAFAGVFQHRQVMQWNVRAAPSVRCWRQVVGIGFTGHLEDSDRDFFLDFRSGGKPLAISPTLHDFFGFGVARLGFVGNVIKEVEHQQRFLQRSCGHTSYFSIVEQFDQGVHVVAAHHGAEQLSGFGLGDQAHLQFTVCHSRQERGFDFGRIVHAGWHAVGQHIH